MPLSVRAALTPPICVDGEMVDTSVYHMRRCRNGYTSRFQKPTPKGVRVDYLFGRIEEKCPNVEVLDISKKRAFPLRR